jgi:outer membrane receptor protein involved in Fe transport
MKKLFPAISALPLVALSSQPVFAQETETAAEPSENVIIVTAQLREENVQDVPIAITALTSENIRAARIEDALDLQFNAPNVILSANRNLTIRGVGSQSFGGSNDTNIGVLINGVFLQQGSTFGEFFDLERVEVLRGPQGTLFGRNTTGGLINFVTRKPTDDFEGYVSAQVENFDGRRVEGAVNVPITEGFGLRFAGHYLKRDGYTRNLEDGSRIDGRDQFTLRGSARLDTGSGTTVDFVVTYFEEDSNRANAVKTLCTPDPTLGCSPNSVTNDFPAVNFPIDRFLLPGIVRPDTFSANPTDLREVRIDVLPEQRAKDLLATFEINQDIGDWLRLTSVTGFRDGSNDSVRDFDQGTRPNAFNPSAISPANGAGNGVLTYLLGPGQVISSADWRSAQYGSGERDQVSQELRLASDLSGPFNFLIGGYYLEANSAGDVITYMPANRTAGFIAAGVTTDASVTSHAIFGEVYFDITPELSVLGGIRYTKDDKSIRTASGTFALGPFFEGEASFDAWTGRGSVTWQPTPDNNIYLTFSRGFKSGGFNPGNIGNPTFDSEFINAWELGSKNTLLDSKLTLNGALFRYDYKNLIVGNIVGTLATNVNIPESRVQGFELETVFTPLEGLRLEGALGLLKAEIRSDFQSSDPSRGGAFFQIQGNELPNAPRRTLKLAAEYNIPVAGNWSLRPRVDYYSQTGFWAREFNVAADRVGSWEQLDLQLQVAHDERDLALIFFVKNVQNNDDITFLEVNSNLVGSFRSAFLLDPRVYGVNLRAGF